MTTLFKQTLQSLAGSETLPDLDVLASNIQKKKYSKGDILVRAGEVAQHVNIVAHGSFRIYYVTRDGKELNQAFKFEGEILAAYASLITGNPCKFFIEALEDSEIEFINYKVVLDLFNKHHSWNIIGRQLAEEHFIVKEKREASFLLLDAKGRYDELKQNNPKVLERVPRYHIASYLGIKPQSLSRLTQD